MPLPVSLRLSRGCSPSSSVLGLFLVCLRTLEPENNGIHMPWGVRLVCFWVPGLLLFAQERTKKQAQPPNLELPPPCHGHLESILQPYPKNANTQKKEVVRHTSPPGSPFRASPPPSGPLLPTAAPPASFLSPPKQEAPTRKRAPSRSSLANQESSIYYHPTA